MFRGPYDVRPDGHGLSAVIGVEMVDLWIEKRSSVSGLVFAKEPIHGSERTVLT